MQKTLVLAMSCNQEFFQKEEAVLRREGYASLILKNLFPGTDFWTYTASTDGKYHINLQKHKLSVPADDSLYGTFEKTQKTFRLLLESDIEFDYIFRTNLSTHINPWVISLFVDGIPETHRDKIYSTVIYCSKDATGPEEYSLYAVGNSMLIPKHIVKDIAYADIDDILKDNHVVMDEDETIRRVDDNCIGLIVNTLAKRRNKNPWNMWQQVKRIPYITKELVRSGDYSYSFGVPFKDYEKGSTREIELAFARILANNMRIPKPGSNLSPEMMFDFQTKLDLLTLVDFKTGSSMTVPRTYALEFKESGLSVDEFDIYLKKKLREPQI